MSFGWRRTAVSGFFLAGGVGMGAWGASLPPLKQIMRLSEGELGLLLLVFALGAILSMTNLKRIVTRLGMLRLCAVMLALFGLLLLAVPHAVGPYSLFTLVALCGAAFGALDVAMNTEAAFLEGESRRPLMSSVHALFSMGAFLGAFICAQLLGRSASLPVCLGTVGAVILCLAAGSVYASPSVSAAAKQAPAATHPQPGEARSAARHLLLLGSLALLALFVEGAMMDWTAIYLVNVSGYSTSEGAFGFAVLAGSLAFGRLFGDWATRLMGPVALLRLGSLSAALAFGLLLIADKGPLIFLALVMSGLGIANVVPGIFSAAGRAGGADITAAMARVATMGYAGLLMGPPFIGFVAEATSLTTGHMFVVLAAVVVTSGAQLIKPRTLRA
jgi:predicted MFS family arabinose efflux permease